MARILTCLVLLASSLASADPMPLWHGHRAIITPGARVAWSRDGAWLAQPRETEAEVDIYDEDAARPQLIDGLSGARLVRYVERAKLRDVSLPGAVVYPSAAAARRPFGDLSPGIRLPDGQGLYDAVPTKDGLLKVTYTWSSSDDNRLEITGYLRPSAVGKTYRYRAIVRPEFLADITLPGNFKLLDAPGGAPFLVRTTRDRIAAITLRRAKGYTLVRLYLGAVGWVESKDIRPILDSDGRYDDLEMSQILDHDAPAKATGDETLPIGTPLLDAIDGQVIGAVAEGFEVRPAKRAGAWCRYDLGRRHNRLQVWAHACASGSSPVIVEDITMQELEANRISGDPGLVPNEATRAEMQRDGKAQAWATFKICIDVAGTITEVTVRSSKIAAYDAQVNAEVRAWKFRPFVLEDRATPVCSMVATRYPPVPPRPARTP